MIKILKHKWILTMIVIALGSGSCKKSFLEKLSPTSLLPEQALATETDLQAALRGAYVGLRQSDFFTRTTPLLGDLMADNAYVSLTNTGRYTAYNTYTWTVADGNATGFWRNAYTAIMRANNIINSPIATNANIDQYKGEAYSIRALCYFYLVRFFARPFTDDPNGLGVPIVLTYDPLVKPVRSKISDVYAQIISDLNQAYTLMTQFTNSTQFSKYAAKGLLAKVYLTMGDKANAKTAALDVINNSGFTVVTVAQHAAYWSFLTPRTDKVETLFEVSSDATANSGFDGLANIYNQSGYGDMLPSAEFFPGVAFSAPPPVTPPAVAGVTATGTVNIAAGGVISVNITNGGSGYTAGPPTVYFTVPAPAGSVTATGTAVITSGSVTSVIINNPGTNYSQLIPLTDERRKLYGTSLKGGVPVIHASPKFPGTFGSEISDTKLLRMSEMYLIAAEASLPGDEPGALTYVNYITSRRNAAPIASTGAQLFEDIITERRKELAFEGDRLMDLNRLKRNFMRSQNYPSAARDIQYANIRRILPIPQAEMDANPNIRAEQNPGY